MPAEQDVAERVEKALAASDFARSGAVISDLDGTAVHQTRDRWLIAEPVQLGLEQVREHGRPVIINTLRFPLSVIRTFGAQWVAWTKKPLPCVTLNGSLIGDIVRSGDDLAFTERIAFPLSNTEIEEVLTGLDQGLAAGSDDFTVFIYPRDYLAGEIIWTPAIERVDQLRAKYASAAQVVAWPFEELREFLEGRDICMLSVLVENPLDTRLAFQHGKPSSFVTCAGVNKKSGSTWLCETLGADPQASIGAGDTELDTFLDGVGIALHVGTLDLAFRGVHDTIRLPDPFAYGDVLAHVVDHCARAGL